MPNNNYNPIVECLEKKQLLSLNVIANVNGFGGPKTAYSSTDSPIATKASGGVGVSASASAKANSLAVQASGGGTDSYSCNSSALGIWIFLIQGVPAGTKVPLTFTFDVTGDASATAVKAKTYSSVTAIYSYGISTGGVELDGNITCKDTNDNTNNNSKNPQTSGNITGTYANGGNIVVNLSAYVSSMTGKGAAGSAKSTFTLEGVSSPLYSMYPNLKVVLDKVTELSADPLKVLEGQFTFDQERGANSLGVHYSGGGVTIGAGHDLGNRRPSQIISELTSSGINLSQAQMVAKGAGLNENGSKTGIDPKEFVDENKNNIGTITMDQQKIMFEHDYNEKELEVERIVNKPDVVETYHATDWDNLNPAIKTILIDMEFRGDYAPSDREIVQDYVSANNLKNFTNAMSDRNNWLNVPEKRFNARVNYLKSHGG